MSSTASSVSADQNAIRAAITLSGISWAMPQHETLKSVLDIAFDWSAIFCAVWGIAHISTWLAPLAILIVGNRQRALGNLLHEASHHNLSGTAYVNDWIARIFLAPSLNNNFRFYRSQHAKHHAWLGDPQHDPDYLPQVTHDADQWFAVFVRMLIEPATLASSLMGHLGKKQVHFLDRISIFIWWIGFLILIGSTLGIHFAIAFSTIWIAAKTTVFHAITTFREMVDHYGLEPRGILQYTRETPTLGCLSVLVHPHHNGYHLTHHLFPHIPYYHLPRAHRLLKTIPLFEQQAILCDAYITGQRSAVDRWEVNHD